MRPFVVMPRLLQAWTAQGDARKDAACLFPELHRLQPKGIAYPHGIRSGKELLILLSIALPSSVGPTLLSTLMTISNRDLGKSHYIAVFLHVKWH